jgi:two-component system, chemotaxis family, protein-glutamate methylesterase/glutaminase
VPEQLKTVRVLVVEDSATVRARLLDVLAADPGIEIVGVAGDGKEAIELCLRQRPDVITMDMMMPVMSGLAATEYIMAHCPTPILVVSASVNRGELFKIYEALAAGAVDVLEKPLGNEADADWERRLVAAVKLVARIRVITHPRARLASLVVRRVASPHLNPPPRAGERMEEAARRYALVAIGASTGGPGAVRDILRGLPAAFRLPILLVLHINEPFGSAFADWLDAQTGRTVSYARDGMPVLSAVGRVVVAAADQHMIVANGRLRLTRDPQRHSCRPSVDVLFESVAAEYGAAAAACLLTGMGRDGAEGLLRIRNAGGLTIAQDESTSVVYGMPREAALIGAAAHVLQLGDIAPRLAALENAERMPA